MARGREIVERLAAEIAPQKTREDHLELLARYEAIKSQNGFAPKPFEVVWFGKNRVAKVYGEPVAAEVYGPAFPSDQFVAQCALAVAALIPANEVPDYSPVRARQLEERKRRDEQRRTQGQWRRQWDEP